MDKKTRKLFNAAKNDQEFLHAVKEADGDEVPGVFADELEKYLFVSAYYGWLVAKHGSKWRLYA